jgi:hypothetical protein
MLPFLGEFSKKTASLKFDNALRPSKKIYNHLATAYAFKKENDIQKNLTNKQIDAIAATGFD